VKKAAIDAIILAYVILNRVRLEAFTYALRRRVLITTEISDDIKPIKLDTRRMKQIVTNLLSNAIKYSSENTEIKISARCVEVAHGELYGAQNKFLEISITDRGFGMTPDQIQTAFQKYQTIQNLNSGIVDSSGLGLPITK
jgi:two-component system CheB/CheR fusion protein